MNMTKITPFGLSVCVAEILSAINLRCRGHLSEEAASVFDREVMELIVQGLSGLRHMFRNGTELIYQRQPD